MRKRRGQMRHRKALVVMLLLLTLKDFARQPLRFYANYLINQEKSHLLTCYRIKHPSGPPLKGSVFQDFENTDVRKSNIFRERFY